VLDAWLASIPQQAKTLEQSQSNNNGRWPMQGIEVWPNPEAAGSYDSEVAYLTNWRQLRLAYLDWEFNTKAQTATTLSVSTGTLRNGSPVTLSEQVSGGTSPTGAVTFLSTGVVIDATPLSTDRRSGSLGVLGLLRLNALTDSAPESHPTSPVISE
jgi:hypothetical protein